MFKRIVTAPALVLLLIWVTMATAGTLSVAQDTKQPAEQLSRNSTDIEMTMENLLHHVDLWHDAILKGDRQRVRYYEQEIRGILRSDITATEQTVRHYARKAALAKHKQTQDQQPVGVKSTKATERRLFRQSLTLLNTKEHLSRSFIRTEAFSNKYRLINDYIDLLRKQLDMPHPELASEKLAPQDYPGDRAKE